MKDLRSCFRPGFGGVVSVLIGFGFASREGVADGGVPGAVAESVLNLGANLGQALEKKLAHVGEPEASRRGMRFCATREKSSPRT